MDLRRSLSALVRLVVASVAVSLCACAPGLPLAAIGPHIDEEPVIVPYPPPPARVEVIPPSHKDTEVWVDGQWLWRGRRWLWEAGGFVVPPKDSYYAPAITLRQADGTLAYFEGGFRRPKQSSQKSP